MLLRCLVKSCVKLVLLKSDFFCWQLRNTGLEGKSDNCVPFKRFHWECTIVIIVLCLVFPQITWVVLDTINPVHTLRWMYYWDCIDSSSNRCCRIYWELYTMQYVLCYRDCPDLDQHGILMDPNRSHWLRWNMSGFHSSFYRVEQQELKCI